MSHRPKKDPKRQLLVGSSNSHALPQRPQPGPDRLEVGPRARLLRPALEATLSHAVETTRQRLQWWPREWFTFLSKIMCINFRIKRVSQCYKGQSLCVKEVSL